MRRPKPLTKKQNAQFYVIIALLLLAVAISVIAVALG